MFHATELTVSAVKEGYRNIIVVAATARTRGGERTFIQQEVCPDEVLLAVIAVGTGNDWVRTFGISNRYQDAVKAIGEGYSFLQDVGVVSYESRTTARAAIWPTWRARVSTRGWCASFAPQEKGPQKPLALHVVSGQELLPLQIDGREGVVDDRLVYNNLLFSIAIGICKYNVGGMQQLPDAVADDGMLDVSLVRPVHFWHLLFRFHYLFNGGIYRIRHILQERGSCIRIESSPEISVEVDGELLGETPLEFSILHKAVRIVVGREFYDRQERGECPCEGK
ncbi:MAG: diacylglycerol/lipid kinase family protein [Alistipes finegoldii]